MDAREKLVELMDGCPCESDCEELIRYCPKRKNGNCNEILKLSFCSVSKLVQHLISHGVTVQVPQKPIEHKVEGDGIRIGALLWGKGTTIYKCPKCGNFISRMYDYCFKCGQAFDWSDMPQPPIGLGDPQTNADPHTSEDCE